MELSINEKQNLKRRQSKLTPNIKTNSTMTLKTANNNDESRISLKSIQGYTVSESMIAKIDRLEKEIIKKKYELQIVRKDLYNNLEKEQKEKLI